MLRLEADGGAAQPRDFIFLREAVGQVVGRAGGEAGRFFAGRWRLLGLPFGDFLLSGARDGGWGQSTRVDRYIIGPCRCVLECQSSFGN